MSKTEKLRTIFIYSDGILLAGKISTDIINEELIESIKNIMVGLDSTEKIKLHKEIEAIIQDA